MKIPFRFLLHMYKVIDNLTPVYLMITFDYIEMSNKDHITFKMYMYLIIN